MSVTRVFRLPRLINNDPRSVSRTLQAVVARPLDSWVPGFMRRAAEEHAAALGFVLPERPASDPAMPTDITSIDNTELGYLHAAFVAYLEWLEPQLALVEVDADETEAYLEHVKAEIRLKKSGTIADKDAKTINDPVYLEQEQSFLVSKAKAKLLRARVKGYERCAAALSREMTRRQPDQRYTG